MKELMKKSHERENQEMNDKIAVCLGKGGQRDMAEAFCRRTGAQHQVLPGELLTCIAKEIGVKEAKAYSVATFYENFSFEQKGKYVIKGCDGTACHVRKSAAILDAFMKELGLSNKKHTTDDMLFTVEPVSCLGACGLAPTCMVNEEVHAKMTPEKVVELINRLRGENG